MSPCADGVAVADLGLAVTTDVAGVVLEVLVQADLDLKQQTHLS